MSDLFDDLLTVASAFDYVSPVLSLVNDLVRGPGVTFLVPVASSPLTGRDVARLLRRHGIDSWGYMLPAGSGVFMLTVTRSHAKRARRLLDRAGIPVEG